MTYCMGDCGGITYDIANSASSIPITKDSTSWLRHSVSLMAQPTGIFMSLSFSNSDLLSSNTKTEYHPQVQTSSTASSATLEPTQHSQNFQDDHNSAVSDMIICVNYQQSYTVAVVTIHDQYYVLEKANRIMYPFVPTTGSQPGHTIAVVLVALLYRSSTGRWKLPEFRMLGIECTTARPKTCPSASKAWILQELPPK